MPAAPTDGPFPLVSPPTESSRSLVTVTGDPAEPSTSRVPPGETTKPLWPLWIFTTAPAANTTDPPLWTWTGQVIWWTPGPQVSLVVTGPQWARGGG